MLMVLLQQKIEQAVAKEDYQQAANLKKEIEIWKQIKTAVANENFGKAADLNFNPIVRR